MAEAAQGGIVDEAAGLEPIHRAARDGDVVEVARLIAADPSLLNAQVQGKGFTPLMHAAENGQEAVVEKLLALGADTELRSGLAMNVQLIWLAQTIMPQSWHGGGGQRVGQRQIHTADDYIIFR